MKYFVQFRGIPNTFHVFWVKNSCISKKLKYYIYLLAEYSVTTLKKTLCNCSAV